MSKHPYIPLMVCLLTGLSLQNHAQVSLTGADYTQDFNTLAVSGTAATLPAGWLMAESGANANTTYATGTGSSNAGDTYSFGAAGNTDRALGGLLSGNLTPLIGAAFTNNTSATLSAITITYTGEEWRLGTLNRADRLDFQYSIDAADLATGTWTDVNELDFNTPSITGSTGATDGNDAAFRSTLTHTITGLSIPAGATFYIRWSDFNASGADDGLAIDDFTISTGSGPSNVLSLVSGTNTAEGGANGTFTIQFNPPTATAGTTFDYTIGGSALLNTDYTINLSAGVLPATLTAGSGTITVTDAGTGSITVTIIPVDDTTGEGTESITFGISAPSGGYNLGNATVNVSLADNDAGVTALHDIQGAGNTATPGTYTAEAIVTGVYPTLSPAGFYMQEEDTDADANPATAEGIFVVSAATVAPGDKVRVEGTVSEDAASPSFGQAVFNTATVTVISQNNPLPAAIPVSLPLTAPTTLEQYEGMLVSFPQTLTVTDNYNLGRFGEVSLSAGGLVYQTTQITDPNDATASGTTSTGTSNVAAVNAMRQTDLNRTILLDDGQGSTTVLPYADVDNTLRIGSTITNMNGILGYGFSVYRVQPLNGAMPVFTHLPRPAMPGYGAGANLKVASFNVLNYFNGDGAGGGFPTARGANSPAEFTRQRNKIISALIQLDPDVAGLMEMENDGTGPASAIQDLVNGLNAIAGPGTYAAINDGPNGTDAIRCGIIYKTAVVTPYGSAVLGSDPIFDRPPVCQLFVATATSDSFHFVVNHFKSKGSCPSSGQDNDQGDGQSCWNVKRKTQAQQLISLFNNITTTSGVNRIISVGDYNSYYEEDPMDVFRASGYTTLSDANAYSYLFSGQVGSLDHAIVNSAMAPYVTAVNKWHINSAEPVYLDYNDASTEGGDVANTWASTYTATPWRSSDHDPVLVGLNLGVPLPVSLTSFDAVRKGTLANFSWTTASEQNTKEFVVEKLNPADKTWDPVYKTLAAGNSQEQKHYNGRDEQPGEGVQQYRLKMVDADGKTGYSAVRALNFGQGGGLSIAPNPVTDRLIILAGSDEAKGTQVNVFSIQGQQVWSSRIQAMVTQADLSRLPAGVYYLKAIATDGTVTVIRFIKA